jgi:uncharacterized protein (UPF0276 family)
LFSSNELELDYLEVHGPYVKDARNLFPRKLMLLHNSLYQWSMTHADGLAHKDAGKITKERMALAASPWYSLHLGFSSAEVDFVDEAMVALSEVLPEEVVLERSLKTIKKINKLLHPLPVLIENLDYNPTGAYEYVCQPQFINRVLDKSNAYLLLDLAHARVSAAAFGMQVEDYINQLPLARVRQIHLNHPGMRAGRLVDAHLELQDEDYDLLTAVLKRCQPWAVTLEYNHDEKAIPSQIEKLREILAPYNRKE